MSIDNCDANRNESGRQDRKPTRSYIGNVAGVIVLLVILGAIWWDSAPTRPISRSPAPRAKCLNNLKNITLALLMYHDRYKSFPPAYVADEQGRPMYSWRVFLLQFLDRQDLHREFHWDEPWDSPHNRSVTDQVIEVFRCPENDGDPTRTSYFAVIGPNTAWKGAVPTRLDEITDPHDQTILLVEASGAGIHWAEPGDLEFDRIPMQINPENADGISSEHQGSVTISLANGSARALSDSTSSETLRRLLEIDDGEMIEGWQ